MLVLDTSALSRAMHRDPAAIAHASAYQPGELCLAPPVAAEILFGLSRLPTNSARSRVLQAEYARWREIMRWLPWEEEASAIFGEQKARLEARGLRIEDFDIAVASIALTSGYGVATCNTGHFTLMHGLEVSDWSLMPS